MSGINHPAARVGGAGYGGSAAQPGAPEREAEALQGTVITARQGK